MDFRYPFLLSRTRYICHIYPDLAGRKVHASPAFMHEPRWSLAKQVYPTWLPLHMRYFGAKQFLWSVGRINDMSEHWWGCDDRTSRREGAARPHMYSALISDRIVPHPPINLLSSTPPTLLPRLAFPATMNVLKPFTRLVPTMMKYLDTGTWAAGHRLINFHLEALLCSLLDLPSHQDFLGLLSSLALNPSNSFIQSEHTPTKWSLLLSS